MSHITAENLRKAIEDACPIAGISKLIRSVPENQNIYHSNKQAKTLQVFDGERFVEHATDQAYMQELLRMIDRAQALMGEFRIPRRLETCLLNWVYDLRDVIVTDDLDEKRLKLQRLQEIDSDDEEVDKDERRSALIHAKATLDSLRNHIHSMSKTVKPLVNQKEVITIRT